MLENKLAGCMIWEIGQDLDEGNNSLSKTLFDLV